MDLDSLIAIGLTRLQAQAYALLIEHGEIKPSTTAISLNTTRTNAYKVFDKLAELKLANKIEVGKTFAYRATNPVALASLTSQFRAEAVAREESVGQILNDLLSKYYEHSDKPESLVFSGQKEVAATYRQQLNLREDIHFIRTKADIPAMGHEVMHDIRTTPATHGLQRTGILPGKAEQTVNHANHKRSNLEITWIEQEHYTAPVEWSVTKSSLLIVLYATEPHAILIIDKVVAAAFLQLFTILNTLLKEREFNKELQAKR